MYFRLATIRLRHSNQQREVLRTQVKEKLEKISSQKGHEAAQLNFPSPNKNRDAADLYVKEGIVERGKKTTLTIRFYFIFNRSTNENVFFLFCRV